MNALTKAVIAAVAGAMTLAAAAQSEPPTGPGAGHDRPPRGEAGQPGRPHRGGGPLLGALDANHDGVIDASEIAAAPSALKKLDVNSDGKLTRDELMPHPLKHDGPVPTADTQNPPPSEDGPAKGGDHKRPVPPLVGALDANADGVIDAEEIANASKALKSLDKNSDGQLTSEEFAPHRPERGAGPAGERRNRAPKPE